MILVCQREVNVATVSGQSLHSTIAVVGLTNRSASYQTAAELTDCTVLQLTEITPNLLSRTTVVLVTKTTTLAEGGQGVETLAQGVHSR